MYLEARRCILSKLVACLRLNCKAFGGSSRRCSSRQEDFEQACVVYLIVRPSVGRGLALEDVSRCSKTCAIYLIVRPSVGRGLRLEDVSRGKKMYFEQTCVVYLIVRPSVGRGLRLEDISRGKKMYFEQTCVFYLIVFNTRRCISKENVRPSAGRGVKTRRCISMQEVVEQICVV